MRFHAWRKWLHRTFGITRPAPLRRPFRPRVEPLEQRWVPSITASGQNSSFIEGTSNTVVAATFTDTDPSPVIDYSATVDWGDGSSSAGSVSLAGTTFTVTGSHAYTEETPAGSPHAVTVTIQESNGADTDSATANGTASVADAPLTPNPVTFTPTETLTFTGKVATFTDTGGAEPAGNYTATIDWGDGVTTAGTVSNSGSNPVTVSGSHTYAEDGPYAVSVTLKDEGGQSATAGSTANVKEGNFVLNGAPAITITEGTTFSGTVATFIDPGSPDPASAFSATINWGDGTTDAGTVTGTGGTFTVTGSHTYTDELNGNINVTVSEGNFFALGPNPDSVSVVEGDTLTGTGATFTASEGTAFSGNVATFTDTRTNAPASGFTASINWGDGTTTTGTVTGSTGGPFTVSGTHTYIEEGPYSPVVTLTDDAPGTASAAATGSVAVSDQQIANLFLASPGFTPPEGASIGGPFTDVATFIDPAGQGVETAADFTASIDWGDGVTDAATVVSDGNGNYHIDIPDHTYAEDGPYNISITVTHDLLPPVTSNTQVLNVTEADLTLTPIPSFTVPEGVLASGEVATFTDSGSPDGPGAFSATINWGDGTTGTGTITGSGGNFTVSGGHTYADEGTVTVTVTVTETGVVNGTATTSLTGTITEADSLAGNATSTVTATEAATVTPSFTFSDTGYPSNSPTDFSATIDWGDGSTTTVTVSGGSGTFTVSGSHTYADEGTFTATATLTDATPGTASATATQVFNVLEGDTLAPAAVQPHATLTEGDATTSGTIAVFSDTGYPTNSPSDFTATINWGDGTVTPGTVSSAGDGNFTVSGSHAYADEGTFTATATLTDATPGTATATATSLVTALEADTLSATATPVSATEGTPFSGVQVATFTTTYTGNVASDFTAVILWGDGTSSTGAVSGGGGNFTVTGSHTYFDEGVFTPTVFISDDAPGTASASASGTAIVAEGDTLTGTASDFVATEGQPFSGQVATFTDTTYPSNQASDFTASIDWGDGTSSTGTVVGGGGGTFLVSGSHTYADEGTFTVTVTLTDDVPGSASATASATATVDENDFGGIFPATITPTEGKQFSGSVATFTEDPAANPLAQASDFTAMIDWGDGTTDTGTVTGPTGGPFTINGTHTYADEGTFTVLASFVDDPPGFAGTTITSSAVVAEADALAGTASSIAVTEQSSFSGTVATFTDTNASAPASDFTATIDWGDGTTTAGTVSGANGGPFTVSGTHTYAEDGSYRSAVALFDDDGHATAFAIGTATVSEASLALTAVAVHATEGHTFSGAVATASDPGSSDPGSAFSATIDWGDGTTTAGTVSGSGGSYTVSGQHTYADEGSFTVRATLTEAAPGSPTATSSATASVAEGDSLVGAGVAVSATEGKTFTGAVATFRDSGYPGNSAADFSATIDWGDGTTGAGTVTGGNGTFTVSGQHTYLDEGSFTVRVTLRDDVPGTASATSSATATVAEGDGLLGVGRPLTATEGASFSGAVAVFSDIGYPANVPGDFTATIAWGDGTTTAGTVSGANGVFTVSGHHTYADEGSFTVTATLRDDAPGTASATASSTASVAEGDSLVGAGVAVSATEGKTFTGAVATFRDSGYPGNSAADFSATIDWGDGTTGAGTVTGGNGTFTVSGQHTYLDEGSFTVRVTLRDDAPGTASATSSATATVAEGDILSGTGVAVSATEGTTFSGAVAVFSDPGHPANAAGDFSAIIAWGDGTTTTGTVTPGNGGQFTVSGQHTYAEEGTFTITVTLRDDAPGTASATASSTATAGEGDSLTPVGAGISATEGSLFSGTVATFLDSYTDNVPGDFTASIDWGDGTTTAGTVSGGEGLLSVSGSHTYLDEGSFAVTVTLRDDAPGTASATASSTAVVTEADRLLGTGASLSATEGVAFSGTVATFTDPGYPGNVLADFTASIDWGDGTTTAGTISGNSGAFTVSGSHTYAAGGSFTVTASLSDDAPGSASASASSPASVAGPTVVSGSGVAVSATEGTPFLGVVATFATSSTGNVANAFSAVIDWGDGTTTTGTVTGGSSGSITVSGSHTYADEGAFTVTTVLRAQPSGTAVATASSPANAAEADDLTGAEVAVAATQGRPFRGAVATFSTTYAGNVDGDFSATIDWGDGTTAAGTVTGGNGSFTVSGEHTYANEGAVTVTVTLSDDAPGTASASVSSVVNVIDPTTDIGVYEDSTGRWLLRNSATPGAADSGDFFYGRDGLLPVTGDWAGTGHSGIGVYDPVNSRWLLRSSATPGAPDVGDFFFGVPGGIPLVGDWTGSGHIGIGVYDPSNGHWMLRNSASAGAADFDFFYGGAGFVPVVGDWGGIGHTSIGVYELATGHWLLRSEVSAGNADAGDFFYGRDGVVPVVGDWAGTGHSGIGVYEPATGRWMLRSEVSSGDPDAGDFFYGRAGLSPVTGNWAPGAVTTPAAAQPRSEAVTPSGASPGGAAPQAGEAVADAELVQGLLVAQRRKDGPAPTSLDDLSA